MIEYKHFGLFQHEKGSVNKDWKIECDGAVFSDWEMFDQSIELTECLCSEKELRFGSCEASILKFRIGNVVKTLVNKWFTLSVVPGHYADEPLMIGKYKIASEELDPDRQYKRIVAYDAMYDILNTDMAAWYNSILPAETSTMSLREFRQSFLRHFGLEEVLPKIGEDEVGNPVHGLVNDGMTVERTINPEQISGKDIITAICEINGCFGHIGRDGKFHYIYLPQEIQGLWPADDLYPADDLFPIEPGTSRIGDGTYIQCDCENFITQGITMLQIRKEENDIGKIWPERAQTPQDNCYIIEDNFLVYGKSSEELAPIAENILEKIRGITYQPFDCEALGNPCFEVGDPVRLPTKYELVETYILERTLTGIQALRDKYRSQGVEKYAEQVNGVHKSIKQLKGKTNVLTRTLEETRLEMADVEKELKTEISATAAQIRAELQNTKEGLEASLTLTDKEIRAELKSTKEGLESSISQTAGQIRAELQNTKEGLEASITATAGQIRTEVSQTYETKVGAQAQYNSLSSSISQTSQAISAEVSRATAAEGNLSSQLQLLAGQIVLKADANGRMVQVALNATPSTGSEFKVDADNINLSANDVMNLLSGGTLNLSAMNINITSNNWGVDSQGHMWCNSINAFKITGEAVDQFNKAVLDSKTIENINRLIEVLNQRLIDLKYEQPLTVSGNGMDSPEYIYGYYNGKFDMTNVIGITITYEYYYVDSDSDEMGDPKKYYYNTYEVGVGVSNNKATFNSYQSFSFGNLSYEKTMKGTRSQNVDVSGLKGEYYIGARIRGYNSYTGGMLKGYSTQQSYYIKIVNMQTF